MKIAIGSDHRGFQAKERIKNVLIEMGFEVVDHGPASADSCDYSDMGLAVADQVGHGAVDRGILFCGTGIGMSIAANKVRNVRAALCHDEHTVALARRHNNTNVLCLPADLIGDALMQSMVRLWIDTDFEGGRHARRLDKIAEFENHQCGDEKPAE